ncbi:MAG: Rpn family recombination-promoting nuclease/putative transposase [Halorhodospira sp.]
MAQEVNPHDAFLKKGLDSPQRAGVFLRESLPESVVSKLSDEDPQPLETTYIEASLRETRSDKLFQAWFNDGLPVYIYVLIEHKSVPDPKTPLQLLDYMQQIWRRHVEQDAKGQAERMRHLPPIIPLVIYNGPSEWTVPLSVLECMDADERLRELQSQFGYQVRHLRPDESDESYSQDPALRAVLRALAWAYVQNLTRDDLVRLLQDLPAGHPLEKPLLVYIARVYGSFREADMRYALEQVRHEEQAEELRMTVAEEWIKRGKEQGRQEGRLEAGGELLLMQLQDKFGSEAAERHRQQVEQADEAMIRTWSIRLLRAETVDEVFTADSLPG